MYDCVAIIGAKLITYHLVDWFVTSLGLVQVVNHPRLGAHSSHRQSEADHLKQAVELSKKYIRINITVSE